MSSLLTSGFFKFTWPNDVSISLFHFFLFKSPVCKPYAFTTINKTIGHHTWKSVVINLIHQLFKRIYSLLISFQFFEVHSLTISF